MRARCTLKMAPLVLAACMSTGGGFAHADDNSNRFTGIKGALATAAPETNGWSVNLAGAALDTPQTPITLFNYDTPDPRSFGAENVTNLIFGPTTGPNGGLGNAVWGNSAIGTPCAYMNGRTYGTVQDIRYYWSTQAAAPAYKACATNTHLMYNDILQAVRECGEQCFVDIASLEHVEGIRRELRGSIAAWLVGKPNGARMVLRLTEGYISSHASAIRDSIDFFAETVRAGQGKLEVYGLPITSGPPALGTWSHVKLFAVHDVLAKSYRALFGGQNHWFDYDADRPPYDSNTRVTGHAAAQLSLQLDAAGEWFDDGRAWVGRSVWYRANDATVRNTSFKWNTAGYANVAFGRFSGVVNVNPRTVAGTIANGQRAVVSLMDMGDYSTRRGLGRTIARVLHDLVMFEPRRVHIRVFNQQISRSATRVVDGNYGGRSEQTYIGRLVYRALTAARMGWPTNVWVLTSDSQIQNDGYESPFAWRVRNSLYLTGRRIACVGNDALAYAPGWNALRFFNNPNGRGSCQAAVIRAVNSRFRWRMTTAFINGFAARQPVGVHHKIVMFGREAMYQGSFNAYPSAAGSFRAFDSKLVENGALIFDAGYVNSQVNSFEEAWQEALPILGG